MPARIPKLAAAPRSGVVATCKIVNVAQVELPTASVTINSYVPFPVINVLLVYVLPLNVAVTQVVLSEKVILTDPV